MAGNRCEQCEKFVSFDSESTEPEITSGPEVLENEEVSIEIRAVLACAECGEELKEYNTELNEGIPDSIVEEHKALIADDIQEARDKAKNDFLVETEADAEEDLDEEQTARMEELMDEAEEACEDECVLEAEVTNVSVSEEYGGKGRKGFQKKFYVIDAEVTITCSKHSDFSSSFDLSEKVQASHFDEL